MISKELIKQDEKPKIKASVVTSSTIFMAWQKHHGQLNSRFGRRMPQGTVIEKKTVDTLSHKSCTATISTNPISLDWYTYSKDRVISP